MTAMFTFLFLSIVIFIITTGMEQTINKIMTPELKHAGTQGSSWNIILDPLKGVAWWSVTTLEMVFWMLLGWAVLDQAKEFAKSFSKGGFSIKPIGSPFGGMVNNVATQAALGTGKRSGAEPNGPENRWDKACTTWHIRQRSTEWPTGQ